MKKQKTGRWNLAVFVLAASTIFGQSTISQQDRTWSVYKAEANSSNYSPLDQINVSNVNQLKPAWILSI